MTVLPLATVEQIVGHLLFDGGLAISYTSVNSYFYFTQTLKRFEYVFLFLQAYLLIVFYRDNWHTT